MTTEYHDEEEDSTFWTKGTVGVCVWLRNERCFCGLNNEGKSPSVCVSVRLSVRASRLSLRSVQAQTLVVSCSDSDGHPDPDHRSGNQQ